MTQNARPPAEVGTSVPARKTPTLPSDELISAVLGRTLGYSTPDPALAGHGVLGLDVDLALMALVARIDDHPDRERAARRRDELAAQCVALLAADSVTTAALDPFDAYPQDDE